MSVHGRFPRERRHQRDEALEARMSLARQLPSQVLSLRKREKCAPAAQAHHGSCLDEATAGHLAAISELVKSEVNVKVEVLRDDSAFVKRAKAHNEPSNDAPA